MARVAVQSDKSAQKVAKLVYKSKGPFVIVSDTGFGSYLCRKYGRPNGKTRKYLTEDLYLLPPQILPCDEIDTPDLRYLNSDFAPHLKHPFHNSFDIEAYNTKWFDDDFQENDHEIPNINNAIDSEVFMTESSPTKAGTTEHHDMNNDSDSGDENIENQSPVKVTEDREPTELVSD